MTLKRIVAIALIASFFMMGLTLSIGLVAPGPKKLASTSTSINTNPDGSQSIITDGTEATSVVGGSGTGDRPTVDLKASTSTVNSGGAVTLTWTSTNNPTSCDASGGWSGTKQPSGSEASGPITAAKTFTLTCTNASGSGFATVSIGIAPAGTTPAPAVVTATPKPGVVTPVPTPVITPAPGAVKPTVSISASPTTINAGSSSAIAWSINNTATAPVTCTASGGWSGGKATSGSQAVTLSSATSFTLTCSNAGGSDAKSVTVTVNPAAPVCGTGGACSLADISGHTSAADCWVVIKYNGAGGNGGGKVYKINSGFFTTGGQHSKLGGPALTASAWCGQNISSTFNSRHGGGTVQDTSGNTAIWWLTNNGNGLIGDWSGN